METKIEKKEEKPLITGAVEINQDQVSEVHEE